MGFVDRLNESITKGLSRIVGQGDLGGGGHGGGAIDGGQKGAGGSRTKGLEIDFLPIGKSPAGGIDYDQFSEGRGEKAYLTNAVVFACVSRLVTAYLEASLTVLDKDDQPDWNHPLWEFLENPDPFTGRPMEEIQMLSMVYAAWGGVSFLHKVYNKAGQFKALQVYSRQDMWPDPIARHYWYRVGSQVLPVPWEHVIPLKWPAARAMQPSLGVSPVEALAAEIGTDSEATRYVKTVLENDTVVRGALVLPEDASTDKERDDILQQKWEEKYTGSGRGRIAVLSGGVRFERLSLNLEELAIEALRKVPEARICGAFGVPAILAGVNVGLERSTFSNTAEARRFLAENQMASIWTLFGAYINRGLITEWAKYGKGYRLTFDRSAIASLQENESAKAERIIKAWDATLIRRDEARAGLGYEPIGGELGEQFKAGGKPVVTVHEAGDPNTTGSQKKPDDKTGDGKSSDATMPEGNNATNDAAAS